MLASAPANSNPQTRASELSVAYAADGSRRFRQCPEMFIFFSNRLGCIGSLLISAIATFILLLVFGVIHMR